MERFTVIPGINKAFAIYDNITDMRLGEYDDGEYVNAKVHELNGQELAKEVNAINSLSSATIAKQGFMERVFTVLSRNEEPYPHLPEFRLFEHEQVMELYNLWFEDEYLYNLPGAYSDDMGTL